MPRLLRSAALVFALLACASPAFAEAGLYSYLRGGLASSTLTGDVSGEPGDRRALQLGLGVRFLVTDTFGMDTEVNYIQRGLTRKDDANTQAIGAESMTYALNYWQWNGMLHAGLPMVSGMRPALQAGMGFGFLTAQKLKIEGGPSAGETEPKTMDSLDMTGILGVSVDFGDDSDSHWFADARLEKSLMSTADPLEFISVETPNYRNRSILLAIGYKWMVRD
ncbi:MAG: porin family protein [Candidatus Eisenbacteria bacterium]